MKTVLKIFCRLISGFLGKGFCVLSQYPSISNIHQYLILLLILVSVNGYSQNLNQYLEQAIHNNPSLQASFKQYQASLEKVNQVSLENPQLNIGVFTRPMELLMGNQRAEASIMQMFPWFGMLKTQKDEAILMAESRYEAFRQERNRVIFQVKETYFQLIQLQHTIDISQANLEILKILEEVAIIRYQGGNTAEAVSSVSKAIRNANPATSSPNQL
jgi:hypothetical protein